MKVAVLGCGPAGLLAAHAAVERGHEVRVYSQKVKSQIHGAQYLHERIPGLTSSNGPPDGEVRFIKLGDQYGYADKVYGSPGAQCSWAEFDEGKVEAWSMRDLYARLWTLYGGLVTDTRLTPAIANTFVYEHDLVFNSIPAPMLCHGQHSFPSQQVFITKFAERTCPDDTIIYNGLPDVPWYRTSRLFGFGSTESTQAGDNAIAGMKPLGNNCDCHPEIRRVGRFGRWEKGQLVHHAYREACDAL